MRSRKVFWGWTLAFIVNLGLVFVIALAMNPIPVSAAVPTPVPLPKGPDRFTSLNIDVTLYEWWIAAWRDNNVFCSLYVDYGGVPSGSDVLSACGQDFYDEWKAYSAPCLERNAADCPGYYFIPISSKVVKRDVTVK
ncbi:MAG: hypothetical protein WCK35_25315, partial [Chloroflexota bacterium]